MIPFLATDDPFPPVRIARRHPNGLLAAGGDLSVPRLLDAYRQGIFPWYSEGEPILWWSPDPRMVLVPGEVRVSRSLAKALRNRDYEIRVDSAFGEVVEACAAPRSGNGGTWITGDVRAAYSRLHRAGRAHSVETWIDGRLAGGLYGVAIGRMFYGESMFSRAADASKMALVYLARQLERWRFGMIDCQMITAHLASMGGREMPRAQFGQALAELINYADPPAPWRFEMESIKDEFARCPR
jgi:leucyl/phenylalanyl-tRNA--protein transferase